MRYALVLMVLTLPLRAFANDDPKTYQEFKAKYHAKTYGAGAKGDAERKKIFDIHLRQIKELNAANKAAGGDEVFGVTEAMDQTRAEFAKEHKGYRKPSAADIKKTIGEWGTVPAPEQAAEAIPDSVDWRSHASVVGPIKNQGHCGSCWAFSIVNEIESMNGMTDPSRPILSTQQVVSCDPYDYGCDGGNQATAIRYIRRAGLQTAAQYPYVSGQYGVTGRCGYAAAQAKQYMSGATYAVAPCQANSSCAGQAKYTETLKALLATNGPMSVCGNASNWNYYRGGVVTEAACPSGNAYTDHCFQLVGYDAKPKDGGAPYWLIRNQWGSAWGEQGYIRMKMGENACGILSSPVYIQP